MMNQHTLTQMKSLRLDGMARAFEEQLCTPTAESLPFEERVGLLLDREVTWRDSKRLERLLKSARLKFPQACIEEVDYRASRGLDKRLLATLAGGEWIRQAHNLLLTGPTGVGKTWLACALCHQAARLGFSTLYLRTARLFEELRIAHADGSFSRKLAQLAKTDVVLLDDWALTPLDSTARADLLEILDDRVGTRSTILTSQLPPEHWHTYLNDPTLADAILDRLIHRAHKINIKGDSLRKNPKPEPQNPQSRTPS
ncbi:MAG: IS21-like element helper ATPase IstB [Burkholderiales bacterium]